MKSCNNYVIQTFKSDFPTPPNFEIAISQNYDFRVDDFFLDDILCCKINLFRSRYFPNQFPPLFHPFSLITYPSLRKHFFRIKHHARLSSIYFSQCKMSTVKTAYFSTNVCKPSRFLSTKYASDLCMHLPGRVPREDVKHINIWML